MVSKTSSTCHPGIFLKRRVFLRFTPHINGAPFEQQSQQRLKFSKKVHEALFFNTDSRLSFTCGRTKRFFYKRRCRTSKTSYTTSTGALITGSRVELSMLCMGKYRIQFLFHLFSVFMSGKGLKYSTDVWTPISVSLRTGKKSRFSKTSGCVKLA